jgi:Tfp pilus assembly protein PilF
MKLLLVLVGIAAGFLGGLLTGWLVWYEPFVPTPAVAAPDQEIAELRVALGKLPREVAAVVRTEIRKAPPPTAATLPPSTGSDVVIEQSLEEPLRKLEQLIDEVQDQTPAIMRLVDAEDARYQHLLHNGMQRLAAGELAAANVQLTRAIESRPELFNAYALRGSLYLQQQLWEKSVADLDTARKLDSKAVDAWNNLAWIRATCPDEKFRNGAEAVEFATQACELTEWKNHAQLSTLAAAYAESGDFDSAVRWQEECIKLAPPEAAADFKEALELYQREQPYRVKSAAP